jgi:hypothetical protein
MNRLNLMAIFLLIGICFSCSYNSLIQPNVDEELSQEQEIKNLTQLFSEIEVMASSKRCNDSSEWTFTSFGSKACGGPIGYIAYSTTIDTLLFLEKIEKHRISQKALNEKWGIISDCSLPTEPQGIICEEGKPVFGYSR